MRNLGDADRTARLLMGAPSGLLFFTHRTSWTVVGIIAAYLLGTAVMGWDPLYALFRISSRSSEDVVAERE